MLGWLITNKYLVGEKFDLLKNKLLNTAHEMNIELLDINNVNASILISENIPKIDFCLFWDKDILLEKRMENMGIHTFNNSNSIEICDDKAITYLELQKHDVKQPKTIIAPMSYDTSLTDIDDYIDFVIKELTFPMIIKSCFGSFGEQVFLINDRQSLISKVLEFSGKRFIFQEFIKTSFGRDIRAQIVGDDVICSIVRENKNGDFRANLTLGGVGTPIELNNKQITIAIKTAKALNLDFAGIDILFGENDEPLICEVNSNAHFINITNITEIDVAKYIFKHIIEECKRC